MKTPDRAMRDLTDVGDVRRALDTRRVMHDRDEEAACRRSALYEELRLLTNDELAARLVELAGDMAAHYGPRQVLIADIIDKLEESQ